MLLNVHGFKQFMGIMRDHGARQLICSHVEKLPIARVPDLKKTVSKIAIGSFHMTSTRVIPHEIYLLLDNHSISHT